MDSCLPESLREAEEKALLDIQQETDQTILAEIAKFMNVTLAKAALDKLTDQARLADVAGNSLSHFIRLSAINRLTDQRELQKLAISCKDLVEDAAIMRRMTTKR